MDAEIIRKLNGNIKELKERNNKGNKNSWVDKRTK